MISYTKYSLTPFQNLSRISFVKSKPSMLLSVVTKQDYRSKFMNTIATMYRNVYTIIYISGINSDKFPCVMSIHRLRLIKNAH